MKCRGSKRGIDGHTAYDKDNALNQLEVLTTSIKSTLTKIYTLTSHSIHVLLRDLIPRGRQDKSNLFTHSKGTRTDHILNLRAHHNGKRKTGAEELTVEQLKPYSAAHPPQFIEENRRATQATLRRSPPPQFIEEKYVEKDDDAAHYTWNDILNAVHTPKTTLFAWVDSFTLRTLRYSETIEKITGVRLTKINKIIAKQITDDEKLTISTVNSAYSAINIQEGAYEYNELATLLAQNLTGFTKAYQPRNTRESTGTYAHTPENMGLYPNSCNRQASKAKKGKGKGDSKGKGKGKPKGKSKKSPKGKSLVKVAGPSRKANQRALILKGKGSRKAILSYEGDSPIKPQRHPLREHQRQFAATSVTL